MNRLERLTSILIHLQSKRVVTGKELAERYEISLRSVYRDIRALEEAGVPIGAESGKGYFLTEGYSLPPVMFKKEEAAALLTGEKVMEKIGDASLGAHFSDAMKKIRSVLRYNDKEYLESLDESIAVRRFIPPKGQEFPNTFINEILNAIAEQKVLDIEYFSWYNEQQSQRQVEPIGICLMNSYWHLISWCRLRKDYRDFRIDRIISLKIADQRFNKRNRESLEEYIRKASESERLQVYVLDFDPQYAKYLYEQKYYYGYIDEYKVGDKIRMSFVNSSVEYFGRWLLVWGNSVEIVEPESLKNFMKGLSVEIYQHYH